jgi:hypothetical protein
VDGSPAPFCWNIVDNKSWHTKGDPPQTCTLPSTHQYTLKEITSEIGAASDRT